MTHLWNMRREIAAVVFFLKRLVKKREKLESDKIELFVERLAVALQEKFKGHWYPENPSKGQAYRWSSVLLHFNRNLPYQHVFFVNAMVQMVFGLLELKLVLCAAGASEWTGYTGRIQSSFGPVRRVGFSTVIWDYPANSLCGWTLGKSVAGETICKFFIKTVERNFVSAAFNTHLDKPINRLWVINTICRYIYCSFFIWKCFFFQHGTCRITLPWRYIGGMRKINYKKLRLLANILNLIM